MNKVILIGRFTQEHSIRNTEGGAMVLSNSIACTRDKDNTDFINVVSFGKTAETIERYFKKGDRIGIEGSIRTTRYQAQDGTNRTNTSVLIDKIEFLNDKPKEQERPKVANNPYGISDDDLPF